MEIINVTMPDSFELADTGDYHLGALNCHEEGVDEMIDWVGSGRNRRLLNKGDTIEAILPNDKRFVHCASRLPVPADQRDLAIKKFKPIVL